MLAAVAAVAATAGAWLVHAVGADPNGSFGVTRPLLWPGQWLVTGYYPGALWAAYVAVGLLLARCDLRRSATQLRLVAGGAIATIVGYGGAAALREDAAAHSNTTWEALGSGGVAVAVIGVLLFTCTEPRIARVLSPLAGAGSMPLTIYTGQLVALTVVLLVPRDGGAGIEDWWLLGGIAVASVLFAVLWRRIAGRGPMEQLMATITDTRPASQQRPVP